MRVLLAKMILQQPDLLLLDEPTNHLDLPSIEWLEKYLQHFKGSVVIVSHDKFFLNRMVTKIDRKSTRLNSSHSQISYAVFCLKKKKTVCLLSETVFHITSGRTLHSPTPYMT